MWAVPIPMPCCCATVRCSRATRRPRPRDVGGGIIAAINHVLKRSQVPHAVHRRRDDRHHPFHECADRGPASVPRRRAAARPGRRRSPFGRSSTGRRRCARPCTATWRSSAADSTMTVAPSRRSTRPKCAGPRMSSAPAASRRSPSPRSSRRSTPRRSTRPHAILQEALPEVRISLSSQVGRIGLIERENAAIMNAALLPTAERVVDAFGRALHDLGLRAPFYVSQNDGTLLDPEVVARLPGVHLRIRADQQHARRRLSVGCRRSAGHGHRRHHDRRRRAGPGLSARIVGGGRHRRRAHEFPDAGRALDRSRRRQPRRDGARARCASARSPSAIALPRRRWCSAASSSPRPISRLLPAMPTSATAARRGHVDRKLVAAAVDEIHRLAEDALDRMKTNSSADVRSCWSAAAASSSTASCGAQPKSRCPRTPASPMRSARR